jgi:hypothetical protein
MTTHADNFRIDPDFRLVATFPLNGNVLDQYTIWQTRTPTGGEMYAICDDYGFNFGSTRTMREALNLCLRNCGWGLVTRTATKKDYA